MRTFLPGKMDKEGNVVRSPLFRQLFLAIIIILVALLAFGLGRLSVGEREAVRIEYNPEIFNSQFSISNEASVLHAAANIQNSGSVVASKNGTKYHYSHCPGAKQIKEENKISFESPQAAEASGYTMASNCKAPK
jgi:hypothetical protein